MRALRRVQRPKLGLTGTRVLCTVTKNAADTSFVVASAAKTSYDFTTAAALPPLSKLDNFVAAQFASPAILGSGPGHDTYVLAPSLLPAGTSMTISDTEGNNAVQLADGLAIASSRVAANALQLTLLNGSVITLLGAAHFGFDAGGNHIAGTDVPDRSYTEFALQVLGVAEPASGFAIGGPVLIGAPGGTLRIRRWGGWQRRRSCRA